MGGVEQSLGQVSITALGTAFTQNFNTLANSGTTNVWTDNTTIAGWYTNRVVYIGDDGTSTTGGLHSYGTTASTERALGALTSGSVATAYIGVRLANNSGSTATSFSVSYRGEQWRQTTNAQTLVFEYQVGATSLTTGTWTAVTALDFTAPKTGTAGALDGNLAANYLAKSSTITVNVNNGQEIWFRWTKTGSTSPGLAIDDFSVTATGSVAPTLTVAPTSLSGLDYVFGSGPSASQSYQLSGANLTGFPGNILVSGSTNYMVSTDNSNFFASVNVPYNTATLAATTIYVRLKAGLSVGTYNGELVTNAGGGATTLNVTCNGTVSTPPTPTLTVTPTSLSALDYVFGSGPSASQSYSLSGTNLTGWPSTITVSGSTNYDVSLNNTVFGSTVNVSYASATLAATTIYVRLRAGLAVGAYNGELVTNAGGGAATVNVTCNGNVTAPSTNCGSETFTNAALTGTYATGGFTGDNSLSWSYVGSRDESTYGITGKGIMFEGATTAKLTSGNATGGIGNFTCSLKKAFTGAGNRQVELFVNGISQGTSIAWDNTTVQTFTVNNINIAGTVVIEIRNALAKQVVIDDISWTCYSAGCVAPTLTGAAQAATICEGSPVIINLTGMVANTTGNIINYSIAGVPQTAVTGINSNASGAASFTVDALTAANNGQVLQITQITNATCSTAFARNVTLAINATPATPTVGSNSPICEGSALNLTSTAVGTIAWTGPNSFTSAVQNPSIASATIAASGSYFVTSTVAGCTSIAGTTTVVVNGTVPMVTITASPSSTITTGTLVTFTATPVNGGTPSYQWKKNGANVGTNSNVYTDATIITGDVIVCYMTPASPCAPAIAIPSNSITMTVNAVSLFCGTETFSNLCTSGCTPGSSTYGTRTWVGDDGVNWTATDSRSDQTITSKAICIRTGTLTSDTYPNGIGNLTVTTKLPFADAAGNLDVLVNGSLVGTVPYSTVSQTTTISGINVSGNIVVQFSNTTTKRIAIDDISWTCFNISGPSLFVSPGLLTGFSYIFGSGPSTAQTYQLSGLNLTGAPGNITVTAPANYEISLNNVTFTSSLLVPYTSATLTATTIYVRLKSGLAVATYNGEIITNSGGGAASSVTVTCNGFVSTTATVGIAPGDLAILAFNTDIGSGVDEISFVCFVPIPVGTTIDITDNAYQKCGTTNGWGISEGWIRLVRTTSDLPAGEIITVRVTLGTPSMVSPDLNWSVSKPQPSGQGNFDMNAFGEQIFFMSGGNVGGPGSTTATSDAGTYSGYFLYGFNTKSNVWTPVCANAAGGGTQNSDKPINFDCFLAWPTSQADMNKYTGLLTPTSQRDWIDRIGNSSNWTGYPDDASYDLGPDYVNFNGPNLGRTIVIVPGGFSNGKWVGTTSIDWFECSNWESMRVPDSSTNVTIPTLGVINEPTIGAPVAPVTRAYTNDLNIATPHTLTINNASSKLDIHGNFTNNSLLSHTFGTIAIKGSKHTTFGGNAANTVYNLEMAKKLNTYTMTLGQNVTINNIFTLTSGKVIGAGKTVTVENNVPAAVVAGTGNTLFANSYVVGLLKRKIYSNALTYDFPVGIKANPRLAQFVNNSIAPTTYITVSFDSSALVGNTGSLSVIEGTTTLTSVCPEGVWQIDPNLAVSSGNYGFKLYFTGFTSLSAADNNLFTIIKRPNPVGLGDISLFTNGGGTINALNGLGRLYANGYAYKWNLSSFSQFAIAKGLTPLPVELLGFTAECKSGNVQIEWQTASEINNDLFLIERSTDARNYTKIGEVRGAGQSNELRNYSYSDTKPLNGTAYYRLVQYDFDGKSESFGPVSSQCDGEATDDFNIISVSQDAINPVVTYFISSNVQVSCCIYDINGRKILCQNQEGPAGMRRIELNTSLSNGLYLINLSDGNTKLSAKIFIR